MDATHYDLDRLERAIDGLVAQQRSLKGQNDVLSERLIERDAQVERLEAELQSADERRKHAIARVDSLIDELDRLDAALDGSMADDPVSDSDTPGTTAGKAVANMSPPSSPSA